MLVPCQAFDYYKPDTQEMSASQNLISRRGEEQGKQPNHKGYGNQGEEKTGNEKLIHDSPIAP